MKLPRALRSSRAALIFICKVGTQTYREASFTFMVLACQRTWRHVTPQRNYNEGRLCSFSGARSCDGREVVGAGGILRLLLPGAGAVPSSPPCEGLKTLFFHEKENSLTSWFGLHHLSSGFLSSLCSSLLFSLSLTLALAFSSSICQTFGMDDGELCVA